MTFFFSSDYNPHTDRSTFYNSAQSTWGKSAQGKLYSKGSPLSLSTFSRKHTKPDVPKGSPLWIIFRNCATFFRKFFNVPKGSPLWVFWYFATECLLINPEGSPFYIFRHYETFEKKFFKNFNFFPKKVFYAFWALDMAPTLDVLVLFCIYITLPYKKRDAFIKTFKKYVWKETPWRRIYI